MKRQPVSLPMGGLHFCHIVLAILFWGSFILRDHWVLLAACVVLAISARMGVARAPLVVMYSRTLGRWWPGRTVVVDGKALRFAHLLGTLLSSLALLLMFRFPLAARVLLVLLGGASLFLVVRP